MLLNNTFKFNMVQSVVLKLEKGENELGSFASMLRSLEIFFAGLFRLSGMSLASPMALDQAAFNNDDRLCGQQMNTC